MTEKKLVYLAHPCGAATVEAHRENLARARRWFRWMAEKPGVVPTADWVLWCEVGDDFDPDFRAKGLAADDVTIMHCDEFWMVGGRSSSGMERGRVTAERHGIKVVDLTYLGAEPPMADPPASGASDFGVEVTVCFIVRAKDDAGAQTLANAAALEIQRRSIGVDGSGTAPRVVFCAEPVAPATKENP